MGFAFVGGQRISHRSDTPPHTNEIFLAVQELRSLLLPPQQAPFCLVLLHTNVFAPLCDAGECRHYFPVTENRSASALVQCRAVRMRFFKQLGGFLLALHPVLWSTPETSRIYSVRHSMLVRSTNTLILGYVSSHCFSVTGCT